MFRTNRNDPNTSGGWLVEISDPAYPRDHYCYVFARDATKSDFVGMTRAETCFDTLPDDENRGRRGLHPDLATAIRKLTREAFPTIAGGVK